jgi:hypothetical protein
MKSSTRVEPLRATTILNFKHVYREIGNSKASDLSTQTSHQSTSVKIYCNRYTTKRVSFNSEHPSSLTSNHEDSPPAKSLTSDLMQNQLTLIFKKAGLSDFSNPLKNHKITAVQRTKMLDWLVEVTFAFRCNERTYFLVAAIFDTYLRASQGLQDKDVHLLGVTCLYLGSKYEDIKALSARVIAAKISHGSFDLDQIIDKHSELLMTLQFNLDIVTPYDIA